MVIAYFAIWLKKKKKIQLGATVEEGPDYCIITPPEKLNITSIDTYDDHRMAMAFSLAACSDVPVAIKDPGCTRKTFPDYFDVLQRFSKHWIIISFHIHIPSKKNECVTELLRSGWNEVLHCRSVPTACFQIFLTRIFKICLLVVKISLKNTIYIYI